MDITDRCGSKLYVGDYFLWITQGDTLTISLGRIDEIKVSEILFGGKKKECPVILASIISSKWNREWCRPSAILKSRKITDMRYLVKISEKQAEGFANTESSKEGLELLKEKFNDIPIYFDEQADIIV